MVCTKSKPDLLVLQIEGVCKAAGAKGEGFSVSSLSFHSLPFCTMNTNDKGVLRGWSSWLSRTGKAFRSPKPQQTSTSASQGTDKDTLIRFGITDQLQEFVMGFTLDTFKGYQIDDGRNGDSESPALVGNVRQDLTEWQVQHANLVLLNVKEISHLRYVLCPRHLKERQFWHIYFSLVQKYVAKYELLAMREARLKSVGHEEKGSSQSRTACEVEMMEGNNLHASNPHEDVH